MKSYDRDENQQHSNCGEFHRANNLVSSTNKEISKRNKKRKRTLKDALRDKSVNFNEWTVFELSQTILKIIFMKQL